MQLFIVDKQKICELANKIENLNLKNLIDKIHKDLKLNIDCHINACRNHNFFKCNNAY
jgi:hypothetical protein